MRFLYSVMDRANQVIGPKVAVPLIVIVAILALYDYRYLPPSPLIVVIATLAGIMLGISNMRAEPITRAEVQTAGAHFIGGLGALLASITAVRFLPMPGGYRITLTILALWGIGVMLPSYLRLQYDGIYQDGLFANERQPQGEAGDQASDSHEQ